LETQKPGEVVGELAAAASTESRPSNEQAATSAPHKSGRPPRRHRQHGGEHRQDNRQDNNRQDNNRQDNRQDRGDRPQRERERAQAHPARFERREREKAPDPNSPFAKLAALKAQLEADAKERR
jgi:ATP-dependent RNA helicase SUPV3L1/SUV3